MAGGTGADRFVYNSASGNDVIRDFSSKQGDKIDFSQTSLRYSDLQFRDSANGAVISSDLGKITLNGVKVADLSSSDFLIATKTKISNSGDRTKVGINEDGLPQGEGELSTMSNEGGSLIGMDEFRVSADFSGYTGAGYTVVVLDTGIDFDHRAFGPDANGDGVSDRIVYAQDFTMDYDGTADDVQGHGSNVASIIGSSNRGYLGIAPDVNIVALQVLGNDGSGSTMGIESGLKWVVDNAAAYNIVSINLSLGPADNHNSPQTTGLSDEIRALNEAGVVTVFAAGNSYYDFQRAGVSSVASDANAIAVGAVWSKDAGTRQSANGAKEFSTEAGRVTVFSQRSDDLPMVFAPGGAMTGAAPGGGTVTMSGTSQAAPVVAGMAVLAQQIAEDKLGRRLTPDEFHRLLIQTSTSMNDGDDEDNNVAPLNANLDQVNMMELARAIAALGGGGGGGGGGGTPPPPNDDYAGGPSTSGVLAVGDTKSGVLETGSDQDWFRMELQAGRTYVLEQRGAASGDGTLNDPVMALMDANGNVLATNDDAGGSVNSKIEYVAQSGGVYYLAAQSFGDATGTYKVSLRQGAQRGGDAVAGDASTTSTLTPDGTAKAGVIDAPGDRDWHRVELEAGGSYVIDLKGAGANALDDPYLRLYDSNGREIASNDDNGDGYDSQILFRPTQSGVYYVGAGAYGDGGAGTYSVSVSGGRSGGGGDVPDDATTGASVAVGGGYNGTLDFVGDRDWIRAELQAGSVYDLSLAGRGNNPVLDTYMRVYDSAGREIASNDDSDGGYDSRLPALRIDSTGAYFISAESYGDYEEGDYRIELRERSGGARDLPASADTSAVLENDVPVSSSLFLGDEDWFRAELVAGRDYSVWLNGAGANPVADTILGIFDNNSTLLDYDDDSGVEYGSDSLLEFTASRTGTYYFGAAAYGDLYEGTYEIGLIDWTANGYSADAAPRSDDSGDMAGDSFVFATSGDGASADPYPALYDAAENEAGASEGLEPALGFVPKAGGIDDLDIVAEGPEETGAWRPEDLLL